MFIDRVTTTPEELAIVDAEAGLFSDPPPGLAAAVAWESGEGEVTCLMVWDTPGQRGDFAFQKMMPLIESGRVGADPDVLQPTRIYLRGA
ncbi:MAG: hypothetical protein AB1Z55_07590 [Acidimicrobiia bacterium]